LSSVGCTWGSSGEHFQTLLVIPRDDCENLLCWSREKKDGAPEKPSLLIPSKTHILMSLSVTKAETVQRLK